MKIKNKKVIILCIILIIAIAIAYVIYINRQNDNVMRNAYIDIWRDNSMDSDIDLYSTGSGSDEKLYLGGQPLHYLIHKNGDIYTYQDSSYQNKTTGERDPATINYIKTLSKSDLKNLENELKEIAKNNDNSVNFISTYYYIKINGNSTRVNVDVKTKVLNNYL